MKLKVILEELAIGQKFINKNKMSILNNSINIDFI